MSVNCGTEKKQIQNGGSKFWHPEINFFYSSLVEILDLQSTQDYLQEDIAFK